MSKLLSKLKLYSPLMGIVVILGVWVKIDPIFQWSPIEIKYDAQKAVALSSLMPNRGPAGINGVRGLDVVIPAGHVAYLDEDANVGNLIINGELHCDEANAPSVLNLRAKSIYVNGVFQCGTSSNPYNKKLIISLKESNFDPRQDPGFRGLSVMAGGKVVFNGDTRKAGWVKLNQTAQAGDNFIIVSSNGLQPAKHTQTATRIKTTSINKIKPKRKRVSRASRVRRVRSRRGRRPQSVRRAAPYIPRQKFYVGDKIAIGPTGFDYAEAESFTITSIDPENPNKLYLDGTIQHMHWGERKTYQSQSMGNITLDERAEVANLTRNIVIQADEEDGAISEGSGTNDQIGGHVIVFAQGQAFINGVEFYKMGQAGIMARYPFHWHVVGDAPGQYIKNSSIHHSFQRCITVHRTNKTLVQNNVCYDFKGHGYFLEDGNEIENRIIKNLAIMAKAPSSNKLLLASDDINNSEGQGRFPSVSGMWISNPDNYVVHNVVSGSIGSGIWMSFEKEVKDFQGNVVAQPLYTDTDVFNYNSAHSCKVGITWDGAPGWQSANNPNNPNDKKLTSAHYRPNNIPVFKGLRAWKNYLSGVYFRGDTAIYENAVVAENGWSFWVAYNQIVKDSVFIGRTPNTSNEMEDFYYDKTRTDRHRRTGMVLYDGPFEIHNSDFLDFDTEEKTYQITPYSTVNSTAIPFTSTGGSNKFTNLVSGLHFSPEPIFRAHMQDVDEYSLAKSILGNAIIRDQDGSLSGTGVESVLVGYRSTAIMPNSNCVSGEPSLHSFKVCPGNYTEGSFAFMRWGANAWSTPYVVRRSDGVTNYPFNEWNSVGHGNNLFATANSMNYMYELLPKYQYETDRLYAGGNTKVDSNTESENPIIPIVKIVAYGNNCRLEDGAIEVNSIQDLFQQTETSYFTDGEDFYVRVIPVERWKMIVDDPRVQATALATNKRYNITCDEGFLPKRIVGKITNVDYGATETTISGWACNYTHSSAIRVKVYAYGPAIAQREEITRGYHTRGVTRPVHSFTLLDEAWSNQASDPKTAINCGYMSKNGRKFSISIPNEDLASYTNHKFYVKGISNSGDQDMFIQRSGVYRVQGGTIGPIGDIPVLHHFQK